MKIAFQGIEGSFSEIAAMKLANQIGAAEFELIPMATSENVCKSIDEGSVKYGVVAIENSIGGVVSETREALNQRELIEISKTSIPISQCIFKFSSEINNDEIKFIASHEQALRQCENTIKTLFPNAEIKPVEDTALAAKRLKENILDPYTAVICSKHAGEINGLSLLQEDAQDRAGNRTYFTLFTKAKVDKEKFSIKKVGAYFFSKEIGMNITLKALIVTSVLASYYLTSYLEWSALRSALAIGGPVSAFCIFLTSSKFRVWLDARRVCGYWAYYVKPNKGTNNVVQLEGLKRIVAITTDQSGIHIKGWLCSSPVKVLFESDIGLITPTGKKSGTLMYRYVNSSHAPTGVDFNGMARLEFFEETGWRKIKKMSGLYINRQGDMGQLELCRIDQNEYERWINE
ncbi:prephenate dehydratase domain-containing protein [Pseudoalteromonas sp. BZB3]|uniref:prephenate dehydratase domain-containing protein n=1 Tax=Pseudoalteromonas sp. BZB3 TaxID=3136670 RepID=UPI0032C44F1F